MTNRLRLSLLCALCSFGCEPEKFDGIDYTADWTDADRVGTHPDFYDKVPKNILMISVDTYRRDQIGAFGGPPDVSPTLDRLAKGGVAWANNTTVSNWTFCGITSTLRGAYNVENEFIPRLSETERKQVPAGSLFLANWLQDAGFYTAVHSGNSWFSPMWANTNGYETVVQGDKDNAFALADAGLEEMDWYARTYPKQPWFLHVHLMEPHAPYVAPAEYTSAEANLEPLPFPVDWSDKDEHYKVVNSYPQMNPETQDLLAAHLKIRYQGELKWWNDQLQDILIQADARGLLDDTLVVLWNDHGEQIYEHGYETHAYTLFREENDGWVIFWAKNIVPERVDTPTVSIDLTPTLLQLHDIPIPPEVTGYPQGSRPPSEPRYATTVARLGALQSVRIDDWKMNFNWSGQLRVYDLANDPLEQTNLFDANEPKSQELWEALRPWVERTDPLVNEFQINWPPGM